MDVKLDSLIEKIRKEGIEEAQQTADQMVKDAKEKAASIIEKANKEAKKIIEDGKHQVDQYKISAETDLKQAARNFELLLKDKIMGVFDNVFKREVADAMTPDFLKELILRIVDNWSKDSSVEIVVSEEDKDKLEKLLFTSLKKDVKDSITLKASPDVSHGFRIGLKGEQVYYDFSDEAIADVLKTLINPRLKEILEK